VLEAYKRQSLLWHPDRHAAGDEATRVAATRQMQRINNARDVLGDAAARAAYDVRHQRHKANGSPWCGSSGERRLSVAGLQLAHKRWRLEHTYVIDAVMPGIEAHAAEEREADSSSYYEQRMRAAADRGAVESVAYGLVYAHGRDIAGRNAPLPRASSGKLSSISVVEAGREELVSQPARVREAVRAQMQVQDGDVPCSFHGTRLMLQWATAQGMCTSSPHAADVDPSAWMDRVYSMGAMTRALARMRPRGQAAGADGWLGVLLRWAPPSVQRKYLQQIRRASQALRFPSIWPVNLVTHVPKPGKSVTIISKMRDLWNCVHGWKINTQMLREEYNRVSDSVMPGCQRGFRGFCDASEAASIAVYQTEEASTLCTTLGRVYVDLSGFFMGVRRDLLLALEGELGVAPGVTACMKTVHDAMEGRADTAFGLSEAWGGHVVS
jgi:curved DNA-binding protein CbpA